MKDDRPNILLVMTDQQRFDTIAAHGGAFGAKTPVMDNLVRRGVTFDQAFCTTPICSASRASIMTGLFPTQTGVFANLGNPCQPMSPSIDTIGHRMQAAGYQTTYYGKWHIGAVPSDYGFEKVFNSSHDEATTYEATRFYRERDWLDNKRPFFQVVSYLNPHDVYFFDPEAEIREPRLAPPAVVSTMNDTLEGKPFPQQHYQAKNWSADRWQRYWQWYAKCLEDTDAQIGKLLHEHLCGGFAPNTWIIFTADHADSSGEHGLPFKGPWMYDGVLRVPLIVMPPQMRFTGKGKGVGEDPEPEPRRTSRLTSLIDIVPTIMELAGIPADPALPGKSLLPEVQGKKDGQTHEAVHAEWYRSGKFTTPIRTVRTATHKYNHYLGYGEELYDLKSDPGEMKNLAKDAAAAKPLADLRQTLASHLKRIDDPFLSHRPTDPQGVELP